MTTSELYIYSEELVKLERKVFHQSCIHARGEFKLLEAFVLSNISDILVDNQNIDKEIINSCTGILCRLFYERFEDIESNNDLVFEAKFNEPSYPGVVTIIEFKPKSLQECIRDYFNMDAEQLRSNWIKHINYQVQNGKWLKYLIDHYGNKYDDNALIDALSQITKIVRFNFNDHIAITKSDVDFSFMKVSQQLFSGYSLFDKSCSPNKRRLELFSTRTGNRFTFRLPPEMIKDI